MERPARRPDGSALLAQQACTTHGLHHSLRHNVRVPPGLAVAHRQRLDDLPLPARRHGAIAEERRQHTLVAKVLAPCFELLRALAQAFSKLGKRGPETVGMDGYSLDFVRRRKNLRRGNKPSGHSTLHPHGH